MYRGGGEAGGNLIVILDTHAGRVDKDGEQDGAMEVAMVDDDFETTPKTAQSHTATCRQTDRQTDRQRGGRDGRTLAYFEFSIRDSSPPLSLSLCVFLSAFLYLCLSLCLSVYLSMYVTLPSSFPSPNPHRLPPSSHLFSLSVITLEIRRCVQPPTGKIAILNCDMPITSSTAAEADASVAAAAAPRRGGGDSSSLSINQSAVLSGY